MGEVIGIKRFSQVQEELINEMQGRIESVVYEYAGKVPLATAIGVLEVVKKNVIQEHEV